MNNRVSVLSADQDFVNVSGNALVFTVDTSARLNVRMNQASPANGDKNKVTRYFTKGGLYRVRQIYRKETDAGLIDIGIDTSTNNIFSQLDMYAVSNSDNNVKETLIEISRGYHDIVYTVNGKNASSSNYYCLIQATLFDLIQEYPVYQDDRPAQINQGYMVLLGKHTAVVAESTFTFNFADVDLANKYSEIVIKIHGTATASLALQMKINGTSSGYYADGLKDLVGTLTGVNFSATTQHEIIGTNIITGANNFKARIILSIENAQANILSEGGVGGNGMTKLQGLVGLLVNLLNSLTIQTSTSTWSILTTIEVYGVRKV